MSALPTCRDHSDETGCDDDRSAAHVGCAECIALLQDAANDDRADRATMEGTER